MDDKQPAQKPPSQEAIDQISRDQRLITDEWAPESKTNPNGAPPKGGATHEQKPAS